MKPSKSNAGGLDVPEPPILQTRSLREQVHDYLRAEMRAGQLQPGSFLDLNALAQPLGVSRTPLRDALLQLEAVGYVEILPRRGFRVKPLTLDDIRHYYQVIGFLESMALSITAPKLGKKDLQGLRTAHEGMLKALKRKDLDTYLAQNVAIHRVFLDGCANPQIEALLRTPKDRLNDLPLRHIFHNEWEQKSVEEHFELLRLLEAGEIEAAAAYLRDVHWSFEVQEPFIRDYYILD
ncbi:GntR family transcriptional regulator [Geothrix limicola]|uniref:GntR family transcriptional regulator n=1 Tax=Geothrix limicola TaxID=2927978 RepID=A0ABQ5QGM0_9BACT|nr:GntR family transcriptional regulator [Geothrix limicola]GLH73498.1 GntR family transcriptional regulator [Geothrix limicola]